MAGSTMTPAHRGLPKALAPNVRLEVQGAGQPTAARTVM